MLSTIFPVSKKCIHKTTYGFLSSRNQWNKSLKFISKRNYNIQKINISRVGIRAENCIFPEFSNPINYTKRYYSLLGDKLKDLPLKGIYLDSAATTPIDPRVLDKMLPYMTEMYGNPHSRTHEYGWDTAEKVEDAREKIAQLIGAKAKDIIFTSGATESNNLAVKGVAEYYGKNKKHILTTEIEHKCVLDTCRHLTDSGFDVEYLPVQSNGLIDLELLKSKVRDDTILISVMMVNNEIGVLQPIKEIGAFCKSKGILFHTDAAQAVGKLPINVDELGIDLLSISGHKIYGPKGVGALYIRKSKPRVRLIPIIFGGGQERGYRSGTLPAPLCIGLGAACEIAEQEMERDIIHVKKLRQRLVTGLKEGLNEIFINGDEVSSYPGILNISFGYVEGESLLMRLNTVALSSGSACTSASLEPSYVLRALGVNEELAHTSLRFGITRFTTEEEVDYVIKKTIQSVNELREMSPLWDMYLQGIDLSSINWDSH